MLHPVVIHGFNGVEVFGLQIDSPALGAKMGPMLGGGMLDKTVVRLWVDVETQLPVRLTLEGSTADGTTSMDMTIDGYQWDVEIDKSEVVPVIPEGFELLGEIKWEVGKEGAEIIEVLRLFVEFNDGKFDLVFSMEALYYSPDLPKALQEVFRVLKPGGIAEIVVDCYAGRPTTDGWSEAVGLHMHVLSEADWQVAFEAAGFIEVRTSFVVDSRGAGDEASFEPGSSFPDFESYKAYHDAGSLWIRAEKPE